MTDTEKFYSYYTLAWLLSHKIPPNKTIFQKFKISTCGILFSKRKESITKDETNKKNLLKLNIRIRISSANTLPGDGSEMNDEFSDVNKYPTPPKCGEGLHAPLQQNFVQQFS